MNDPISVLVLGVGGNVSQGILKALALSKIPCRVIGACISPLAVGLYTVNTAYISPRADDPHFLDWLISLCQKENIQAVFSGVEPVLSVLSQHGEAIRKHTGAICLVSRPDCLQIGNDKLRTCQWLERQGLNFPRYAASEDERAVAKLIAECGFPLIAKPRQSKGAHHIIVVQNLVDIAYVLSKRGYLLQEYLSQEDREFTVGCVCDRDARIYGTIVMRRELLQGTTYRAFVEDRPAVREEATRIAQALKPLGPCNIQLRISQGRPVCFEMNIRFSGTTPLRARLGFNEVEAVLRHYILGEPMQELPRITKGVILRYWNEMYVDPEAYALLSQSGRLETPEHFNLFVENYGMSQHECVSNRG